MVPVHRSCPFIIWEESWKGVFSFFFFFSRKPLEIIERPDEIREQGFFGRRAINPETWRGGVGGTYPPPPRFEEERAKGDLERVRNRRVKSRDHEVVIRRLNHDPSAKIRKKARGCP